MNLKSTPIHSSLVISIVGACALVFASQSAQAGRPMTVDDATIAAAGQCQLETYVQHTRVSHEYWAMPACGANDNWELTAGGVRVKDELRTTHYGQLQAKTVLKQLEAGGWGVAMVLAHQFRAGRGLDGDTSITVPLSYSLRGDSVLVNLNAGVLRKQATRTTDASWGFGAEFKLNRRNSMMAEVFGQQRAGSHFQLGLAHALIPDHLQIDATWGRRLARGVSEPLVTLGLVVQTD